LIEQVFADACVEGHVVREGIAEEDGEQRDGSGDARGAQKNFDVDGIVEELGVILKIPFVDDEAVANEPEAVGEHEGVGNEKEKRDPGKGREGDGEFVEAGVHGQLGCLVVMK
jgi:hypothetical protein